ncbi:hypothetical protein [Streptomyces sp. NPDC001978]|uniref:hypothetical protein n=1 Tax=Streptomyces sp. NPDC001978 TaxID=3364627 RepID=UPI0036CA90AE
MPAVLTTASKLVCVHGGELVVQASTTALTVDGSPVLVQADLLAATVSRCTNTNANLGQIPCAKVTSVTEGVSTSLTVGGGPVMLETARGLTNAVPPQPVMWQVSTAGQSLLEAS